MQQLMIKSLIALTLAAIFCGSCLLWREERVAQKAHVDASEPAPCHQDVYRSGIDGGLIVVEVCGGGGDGMLYDSPAIE
jgi:hypothetical protein